MRVGLAVVDYAQALYRNMKMSSLDAMTLDPAVNARWLSDISLVHISVRKFFEE